MHEIRHTVPNFRSHEAHLGDCPYDQRDRARSPALRSRRNANEKICIHLNTLPSSTQPSIFVIANHQSSNPNSLATRRPRDGQPARANPECVGADVFQAHARHRFHGAYVGISSISHDSAKSHSAATKMAPKFLPRRERSRMFKHQRCNHQQTNSFGLKLIQQSLTSPSSRITFTGKVVCMSIRRCISCTTLLRYLKMRQTCSTLTLLLPSVVIFTVNMWVAPGTPSTTANGCLLVRLDEAVRGRRKPG